MSRGSLKGHHVLLITRRLADLLKGGVPLVRALEVLWEQAGAGPMREFLSAVKNGVEEGRDFSDALGDRSDLPSFYKGLVRAGESAGRLEQTLEDLAGLLEAQMEARRRIQSALAYPILLLGMTVIVSFFLTVVVIPRFEFLFNDLGQRLPWPTRAVMAVAAGLRHGLWMAIPAVGLALWTFRARFRDGVFAFRPIAEWTRAVCLERWSRSMGFLLRGGLPLPEALEHARGSLTPLFSAETERLSEKINEGGSLSVAMKTSPLFSGMARELLSAGEETGEVEESFFRLAQLFRRETEFQLKVALSFMEPVLIIGMGCVVGFVALAMVLPIFEMSGNLQ